jgi:hypothetical protein
MDGERFDAITKAFSTGTPRRRVLRGLAGTGAAWLLSLAGVASVAADPDDKKAKKACGGSPVGTRCGNGRLCCNGRCVKPCTAEIVDADCECEGLCCPQGSTCSTPDGTCYCENQFGVSPCGGACCTPDVTACRIEDIGGGHELQECRPCLMSGPVQPGVPCCRVTSCAGGVCTCVA